MGHHFRVLAEDSQRAGRTFAGLGEREIPGIRFEVTPPITMVMIQFIPTAIANSRHTIHCFSLPMDYLKLRDPAQTSMTIGAC